MMNRHIHLFAAMAMLLALASSAMADTPEADRATREAQAVALLDALDEGRYEDAREHFTDEMRNALPARTLETTWTTLPARAGAFRERGELRHQNVGHFDLVIIPLSFGSELQANVAFDDAGRIAGFHIVPATPVPVAE